MKKKTEAIMEDFENLLKKIQKIANKDTKTISDKDIDILYRLVKAWIFQEKPDSEVINYIVHREKKENVKKTVKKIKEKISTENNGRASDKKLKNSITKVSDIEYDIFRISKPKKFKYPGNCRKDAEDYFEKFENALCSFIKYLEDLKNTGVFEVIRKNLLTYHYNFDEIKSDVIKGNNEKISENAVRKCFEFFRVNIFESVIPFLYSHIHDDYETNKKMYTEVLEELNKFISESGIFTGNDLTDSGESLIGKNINSVSEEQRLFYIITPLVLNKPEKNGIITEIEQLPYMTYYMTNDGKLKRIICKGNMTIISMKI